MRYEPVFAAAFVVGLLGAMSQQGSPPQTRIVHNTLPAAAAPAPMAMMMMDRATDADQTMAAAEPITAKAVAAESKPVAPKIKHAKKPKAKPQEVAAAPPPEPRHGFWYRLFHKAPDSTSRVAAADSQH